VSLWIITQLAQNRRAAETSQEKQDSSYSFSSYKMKDINVIYAIFCFDIRRVPSERMHHWCIGLLKNI
jgi:hypothetical protein